MHVAIKKICNFPEKSELPKFILPVKITVIDLFFSAVFRVEIKILQRSGQAQCLVSRLCCLISCGVGVLLKHLFLYEKFDELHVSSVTLQYRSQYTAIVEVMFKSV